MNCIMGSVGSGGFRVWGTKNQNVSESAGLIFGNPVS